MSKLVRDCFDVCCILISPLQKVKNLQNAELVQTTRKNGTVPSRPALAFASYASHRPTKPYRDFVTDESGIMVEDGPSKHFPPRRHFFVNRVVSCDPD